MDNWLLQFEIEKSKKFPDLDRMKTLSKSSLALVRALVKESPNLLEFSKKLPIALLNETEVLISKEDFGSATASIQEAQEILETWQGWEETADSQEGQIISRYKRLQEMIQLKLAK